MYNRLRQLTERQHFIYYFPRQASDECAPRRCVSLGMALYAGSPCWRVYAASPFPGSPHLLGRHPILAADAASCTEIAPPGLCGDYWEADLPNGAKAATSSTISPRMDDLFTTGCLSCQKVLFSNLRIHKTSTIFALF